MYKSGRVPMVSPNLKEVRIDKIDGGLCLEELPYKIKDNQSPDMLNMWYKNKSLSKRYGKTFIVNDGTDDDILNISDFLFSNIAIIKGVNKLYAWDTTVLDGSGSLTEIATGLSNKKGSFFSFQNRLFFLDGVSIWECFSNSATVISSVYIPKVLINCTPTLTNRDDNEQYNLIGSGFKCSYNGDGTANYTLPQQNLDATTVIITVGGVTKTENTHFTVNRITGVITFTSGNFPIAGQNNVEITGFKTDSAVRNKIFNCTLSTSFGGDSQNAVTGGSRIFVSGNANFPSYYWRSGLNDPTYFPEQEYDVLDLNNQSITAFGKMYGKLIVFKTKSIYAIDYGFNGTLVTWKTRELNTFIGCDMPGSIQLIDNRLVFANTYGGVFLIDKTDNVDEKNIKPISYNINKGFFAFSETILKNCFSCDFERKYWLNFFGIVYVWDYDISPYWDNGSLEDNQKRLSWFKFDNIYANCFFINKNKLFCGCEYKTIFKFDNSFKDSDISGINAYWQSKVFDFNNFNYYKTIYEIYLGLRSDTNTEVSVEYLTENLDVIERREIDIRNFNWLTFAFNTFAFSVNRFAKGVRLRTKLKKIVYFSIRLSNNEVGRDLGITDIAIRYSVSERIR